MHEARKCRVPRYYERLFELDNAEKLAEIKSRRVLGAEKHAPNLTPERLATREVCQRRKLTKLIRPLDATDDCTGI